MRSTTRATRWLGILLLALSGQLTHAACNPAVQCCASGNAAGATCGGSGVATQGNSSGTNQGSGNPINIISGNKYQLETDMAALPGILGLEIVRHYNSANSSPASRNGIMGRGWKLSYETQLERKGEVLEVTQADGSTTAFVRSVLDRTHYTARSPEQGTITQLRLGSQDYYVWRWTNGRELQFNERGLLERISAPSGEYVTLQYDPQGWLVLVRDPQGRELRLNYLDRRIAAAGGRFAGVQSIDSPVGRFGYAYGADAASGGGAQLSESTANLTRITLPTHHDAGQRVHPYSNRGVSSSSISRLYHYEDNRHPGHLTGITISGRGSDGQAMVQRINTWAYDAQGRANLSVRGEPARLQTGPDARPLMPARLAAGTGVEQVTLQWEKTSPSAGRTLLDNSLGQRTVYTTVVIAGQPRILEVRGAGCSTCGPTNVRYGYDRLGRLTQETQLDAQGRALESMVTELDGWGRAMTLWRIGYAKGKALPRQWLASYEYPPDGRAEPARISSPSAVNSRQHVIEVQYNAFHQPTQITESGFSPADAAALTRTTRFTYEAIARRSVLKSIDGPLPNGPSNTAQDSDITVMQWDASGSQVMTMTTPGGFSSAMVYDEGTGRLRAVTNGEGQFSEFTHDARGQPVSISTGGPGWSKPQVQWFRYDALGRQSESGTDASEVGYRAQVRQGFDIGGQLAWRASALGFLETRRHDTEGRLAEAALRSGSMAKIRTFEPGSAGRITPVTDRSHGAVHLRDDFGRVVMSVSPDSGTTHRRFDEADRLIGSADALGNRAEYQYDTPGRIRLQTIIEAASGARSVTRWTYAGKRLLMLEHPGQSESYQYDDRGLRTATIVRREQPGGTTLTSVTRHIHDDAGGLVATSLPDGSRLLYERNGQDQVVALKRSKVRTAWLQWLGGMQTIASGIERDLVGPRGYVTGNGIEARYQRSSHGALARVVYRHTSATPPARAASSPAPAVLTRSTSESIARLLPGALSLPPDTQALIDYRYLWDARGNLLHVQSKTSQTREESYAYDSQDRLIASASADRNSRFHYDSASRRVLSQQDVGTQADLSTNTVKAHYAPGNHRWMSDGHTQARYDVTGQPFLVGRRGYEWDALGRLLQVREGEEVQARYTYSHRGERISKSTARASAPHTTHYLYDNRQLSAELNARAQLTRQYIYLADTPIALIDTPAGQELATSDASVAWQVIQDLKTLATDWLLNSEQIVWLHTNHLGAPEMATDAQGRPIWQARYAPFGRAHIESQQGFVLNLRLPGQYEDAETGLHYNQQRYYDPARGEYLTPDPLGNPDGPNSYAYVRYNPLRYVDPQGLILFAFDGTNNSNPPPGADDYSNVYKFYLAYDATFGSANGDRKWYMSGPGRDDPASGIRTNATDQYDANTARARVDYMLQQLNEYVEGHDFSDKNTVDIDMVGFSRGAAMARDFSNRVAALLLSKTWGERTPCVAMRYLGLWDTVAQFGANGADNGNWQLAIPAEVKTVFQAVAMNENRYLFPGEAIGRGVQRGFVGMHADIGGSYGTGDLSDVALNWMVKQATASGITMTAWSEISRSEWDVVTNPVVHGKGADLLNSAFCLRANNEIFPSCVPRNAATPGGLTTGQIADLQFIVARASPGTDADGSTPIIGDVDMNKYAQWLLANYDLNIRTK